MNSLTTLDNRQQHIFAAIDAKPLAATTKAQYRRVVEKALEAGVNVLDATNVATYASQLSNSSRSFLRAALARMDEAHQARSQSRRNT